MKSDGQNSKKSTKFPKQLFLHYDDNTKILTIQNLRFMIIMSIRKFMGDLFPTVTVIFLIAITPRNVLLSHSLRSRVKWPELSADHFPLVSI